jgi:hypothetical protein
MSDKFTLEDDELRNQPAVAVPGTTIKLRDKVAVDTSKPIADAVDDDPLALFIRSNRTMTDEEKTRDREAIEAKQAALDADKRILALREWELVCPPRLRTSDWQNTGLKTYLPHVKRVLAWRHAGQGMYAIGESGKGKSRALWQLARRLAVDELKTIRYLVQGEIMNEINRTGLTPWLEKVDALKRVPIIVWDDFGKFAAIGSRRELLATELFELVDYRFNHELPLLITTNCRTNSLQEIFGEHTQPLIRRLTEGCTVVDFDTPL